MASMGRPRKWDDERNARLGLLIGAGWSCQRIAADMDITETTVRTKASRLGLRFCNVTELNSGQAFRLAAMKRCRRREDIVADVLRILDADQNLVENILDDQWSNA
jgi:hypothetical protein